MKYTIVNTNVVKLFFFSKKEVRKRCCKAVADCAATMSVHLLSFLVSFLHFFLIVTQYN